MYEVYSDHGSALFETENDVASALFLLGHYHDMDIDPEEVRKILRKDGRFNSYPLEIQVRHVEAESMVDRYKELIRKSLPEIKDEIFLHEIYREVLMRKGSQEVQDGPSD